MKRNSPSPQNDDAKACLDPMNLLILCRSVPFKNDAARTVRYVNPPHTLMHILFLPGRGNNTKRKTFFRLLRCFVYYLLQLAFDLHFDEDGNELVHIYLLDHPSLD
mmetsp:Transcript_72995/g.205025  ORF Transcript_72995/g.205025 Transcript_72995/m.205025 type:complete len:106 (-) Transcript_72995:62-379(-)